MDIYTFGNICICLHEHMYAYLSACVCVHITVCLPMFVHACIWVCMHFYKNVYIYIAGGFLKSCLVKPRLTCSWPCRNYFYIYICIYICVCNWKKNSIGHHFAIINLFQLTNDILYSGWYFYVYILIIILWALLGNYKNPLIDSLFE